MNNPKCISQVLKGQGGNYIMPFLWMHGEGREIILDEMDRIADCGIREVCLESRPHPDFLGESWWDEMDGIMDKAREKNMRVWLLDDAHFPTGYGNGVYGKQKQQAKLYLKEFHMDVLGPAEEVTVVVEPMLEEAEEVLGIWLCRRTDLDSTDLSWEWKHNLTAGLEDGTVCLSVPEGCFRLFFLYTTRCGGGREGYMNPIDEDSVRLFLDAVYEPHFERYRKDFGRTFAGFFSDEPEFGNTPGYNFREKLGTPSVALPWSRQLKERLEALWGAEFASYLPALWYEMGEMTPQVRWAYMDQVTALTETAFSRQVGDWCSRHGVEYIGHLIEDDNSHGRLGCSLGHYFRAQAGQSMSGIDVVLLQIIPGFTGTIHQWVASDRDGEFFHFGLGKLGSSGACLDPKKRGRAMCEIFGAYGWGEGISLMKWLTDHMLVRGINVFVPHAFSPTFPDEDCPPHFYARGNNPQYRFFKMLMGYMNRMSHLLSGGTRRRQAVVLYHGDSEWGGEETMLFQKPVRELMEHQMDCDVVPADLLEGTPVFCDGKLEINGNQYDVFIIPYCRRLPRQVVPFVKKAFENGIPVFVADGLPECTVDGQPLPEDFGRWSRVVPLKKLAEYTAGKSRPLVHLRGEEKDLRVCCFDREDTTVWMFFNESPSKVLMTEAWISLEEEKELQIYDGFSNRIKDINRDLAMAMHAPVTVAGDEERRIYLCLRPGEAVCCFTTEKTKKTDDLRRYLYKEKILDLDWQVSKAETAGYPDFEPCLEIRKGDALPNLNGSGYFPRFSGTFRYEGEFVLEDGLEKGGVVILEFPAISECGEVYLNGTCAGNLMMNSQYLDVTGHLRKGGNYLMIEVTNTLVWNRHDERSAWMQLPPTGMRKPPVLKRFKAENRPERQGDEK